MRELQIACAALASVLAFLAMACGSEPVGAGTARLLVTGDFGQDLLAREEIPAGPSVLAALQDLTDVETGYGGGFVEAMYGRSSSGRPRADWFYFVDGRLAETGARGRAVPAGGHVWWDHRRWSAASEVRAVVGAWPAPFASGDRPVSADPGLRAALERSGARVVAGESPWRVRIGSDADLRARSPRWREAAADPGAAGVAGTIRAGGVWIMGADGDLARAGDARAIAVAVPGGPREDDGLSLVVAGLDGAAADAAAAAIAGDPALLEGRFAVAFDEAGAPVASAGQP